MADDGNEIIPSQINQPTSQERKQPHAGSVTVSARSELSYHSPLPPPEILAGYNALVSPDAGDRILKMVERQEEHRQYIEKLVIDGDSKRAYAGLWVGGIIVMGTISLTAYLASLGQAAPGIGVIIAELAGLAAVFVYGSKRREKERRDRIELLAKQKPQIKD